MKHASVANLNQFIGDKEFDQVIAEIEASQEEGLDTFQLDVMGLDNYMIMGLLGALVDMGYSVENASDETFYVKYE